MSAWTAKAVGLISLGYTALTVASFLIVVYVVAVYCIYRSGLNRRFQDSALTRVQMLVAIAWCSYFISGVQALRGVALMLYLFIAMFSFFTLNPRQTAQIVLLISLAYGVIISWDWWRAAPGFDLTLNLIQWVILSIMLLGLWMIARYTSQVREDIHRSTQLIKDQNRQITQTNAELNDALARLNQLAITDELTGLSNRRHFLSTVERHIARCRGNQLTFGLCLLDLDHFKRVNDEYGHQVGDTVLASCARVLLDHMREYDFLARFGGEELVLIVTRGDEAVTRMCAERLRRAVENAGIGAIAPGIELTVSVGATVFRAGDTLEEALGRADKAMYEAKRAGRNTTIFRVS
jgi:diguanylate cyclase (GGDEF)-like protein